jgi:hypothetical protein
MRRRIGVLLTVLAALAWLSPATAGPQDPATFPEGVLAVAHTHVVGGKEFEVAVELEDALDAAAERLTVTVCRFSSVGADGPDVCYMNLGAAPGDGAWHASTGAVDHPAWKDGWVLGYKVTVKTASGETHAPDRLAANGEPDYYRLVVGEPDEPAVQGSAVVEDTPVAANGAAGASSHDAPAAAGTTTLLALALALVGLGARRR